MAEKILLYHAYGQAYLYNQVKFSLLTLHYHLKGDYRGIKIILYTDQSRLFEFLKKAIALEIKRLYSDKIREMKGPQDFVHRVKICLIKECLLENKTDIFYLDSDTYFTANPRMLLKKIAAGESVMNSNDYDFQFADELFENNDWLLMRRAIRENEYEIGGEKIKIPLTTRMWNAGVIGISQADKDLLPKVLDLADQIYRARKVFTAEQFAFSYFLQNDTTLRDSGDVIFHYWRYWGKYKWRQKYTYHFNKFFKRQRGNSINDMAEAAHELSLQHDNLELPSGFWPKLRKRFRLIREVALEGKIKNPLD